MTATDTTVPRDATAVVIRAPCATKIATPAITNPPAMATHTGGFPRSSDGMRKTTSTRKGNERTMLMNASVTAHTGRFATRPPIERPAARSTRVTVSAEPAASRAAGLSPAA